MWQRAAGHAFASYLKLVKGTARFVSEPEDVFAAIEAAKPAICVSWHGEHAMGPFTRSATHDIRILASRSDDGELAAAIASRFGMGCIRGSGGPARKSRKRGGAQALREMIRTLEGGASIALTADMPKISRVVAPGVVLLARLSGRPILPVAVAARRKIRLENTWDKFTLGLPFSRIAMVTGEPIHIPPGKDEEAIIRGQSEVSAALDAVLTRAYGLANGR